MNYAFQFRSHNVRQKQIKPSFLIKMYGNDMLCFGTQLIFKKSSYDFRILFF